LAPRTGIYFVSTRGKEVQKGIHFRGKR
jgi:hypothetical protein